MADFVGKKLLAQRIAKAVGVPREHVEKVLGALAPAVARALAEGKETRIQGFVSFPAPGEGADDSARAAAVSAGLDPAFVEELASALASARRSPEKKGTGKKTKSAPGPAPQSLRSPVDDEETWVVETPLGQAALPREKPPEGAVVDPEEGEVTELPRFYDEEEYVARASDTMIPDLDGDGYSGAGAPEEPLQVVEPMGPPPRSDSASVKAPEPGSDLPEIEPMGRPGPRKPARPETMQAVVAVLNLETDKELAEVLREMQRAGICRISFCSSAVEAHALLMKTSAGILLVGPHVSQREYHGLAAALKLHPERGSCRIVRVVRAGVNPYSDDRMTIVPDEVLEQPVPEGALRETLVGELEHAAEEGLEYMRQIAIRLPSREDMAEQAVEVLEKLSEFTPLGDRKRAELMPAVREAIGTAIRVGNAGDTGKFVDVTCLVDHEKLAVVVKDQGAGGPDAGADTDGSGFSTMIMKRGADEVEILPPGNRVMLTKYF